MEYNKYIHSRDGSLVKELSIKDDSVVLLCKRTDGSLYVLRIYTREISAYKAIAGHDCKSLPKVYCYENRDDLFFIEEEYIDGISLAYMLKSGAKIDEERARKITSAISTAGTLLHERGFIHRDIKPEHIILTADERIVLVDLDASMQIIRNKQNDTQLLGTATYAAPEQFGLIRCDERTDIYSVGILLNEMLTGVHPSVNLYSGKHLRHVIEKCTNISPDNRYQSLRELISDLYPAESNSGTSETSKGRSSKKDKRWWVIGIIAILICIGGFGLSSMQGDDVPPDVAKPAGPAMVENTEYLQLYMDGGYTTYPNFRQGSQSAPLFTEDGERLDQSYSVYTDDNIGFVEWDEERGDWRLDSEGKMPGETGFFYAEKGDKKYAIRVLVFGEPTCVYSKLPNVDDLASGYMLPEINRQNPMERTIKMTYSANKPTTLYLVASPGFSLDKLSCDSDFVTFKSIDSSSYTYPIKKMTFKKTDGGDTEFTVTSKYNTYIFKMTEQ